MSARKASPRQAPKPSLEEFEKKLWEYYQGPDGPFTLNPSKLKALFGTYLSLKIHHGGPVIPPLDDLLQLIEYRNSEDAHFFRAWEKNAVWELRQAFARALSDYEFSDYAQQQRKDVWTASKRRKRRKSSQKTRQGNKKEEFLSVKEFAAKIDRCTRTVKRWQRDGIIQATCSKTGRILRIHRSQLDVLKKNK